MCTFSQVSSEDKSVVDVRLSSEPQVDQHGYEIFLVDPTAGSFHELKVEFKSPLTNQKTVLTVSFTATAASPEAPVTPSFWKFILNLLGETSAWVIGFTFILALVVVILFFCPIFGRRGYDSQPPNLQQGYYQNTPVRYSGTPAGSFQRSMNTPNSGHRPLYSVQDTTQ